MRGGLGRVAQWGNIVDVFKDLKGIIIKKIKEKQKNKNPNVTIKDFFECLQELREKLSSLKSWQRASIRRAIGPNKKKTLLWRVNAMTPESDEGEPDIDVAGEMDFIKRNTDGMYEAVFIPRSGEKNEEKLTIFKDCLNEELVEYNRSIVSEPEPEPDLEPEVESVSEFKPDPGSPALSQAPPRRRQWSRRKGGLSRTDAEERGMLVPPTLISGSDPHKNIHLLGDKEWTYKSLIKGKMLKKSKKKKIKRRKLISKRKKLKSKKRRSENRKKKSIKRTKRKR